MITSIRNPISSTMLAIAAVVVLSVFTAGVARADSVAGKANFSADGLVTGVGGTGGLASQAEFEIDGGGDVVAVNIDTQNELVVGILDPAAAIKGSCESPGDATCNALASMLGGSGVTSLHDSSVKLTVEAPFNQFIFIGSLIPFETLFGSLEGELNSNFSITTLEGELPGEANLEISGFAFYACFDAPIPTDLSVCKPGGSGGQMFPVFLAITDSGSFEIDKKKDLGVKSIKGDLTVTILGFTGTGSLGTIAIANAEAKLFNN